MWQYLWPFSLAIGAFGIIGIVDIVFYLVELSVLSGISFAVVVQLIAYKLPAILIIFSPIAVLFSIMLLLVRMIKDNELLVLLTSGVSVVRIIFPLTIATFITSLFAFGMNEALVPWTNREANAIIAREIDRKPPPEIAENVVFKGTDDRYFYVQRIDRKSGEMQSVIVFEDSGQFPRLLVAHRAQWGLNEWNLWNGKSIELNENGEVEFTNTFDRMRITVNQNLDLIEGTTKSPTEMDSRELKQRIKVFENSGISTQSLKVEYGLKQSIPAACFVFGIIGIAYCFTFIQTGKDWWGVIIAIGIAAITTMSYFFVVAVSRALGKGGTISPFTSVWLANLIFGAWGIGLLVFQSKRR